MADTSAMLFSEWYPRSDSGGRQIVLTSGVRQAVPLEAILRALDLHAQEEWPHVSEDGWVENEYVLAEDFSLLSVYYFHGQIRFWVLTEGDRSRTTVLLPCEWRTAE